MSVHAFHHFSGNCVHPLVAQIDAVLMPRARERLSAAIDASVASPGNGADRTAGAALKAVIDLESLRARFASPEDPR